MKISKWGNEQGSEMNRDEHSPGNRSRIPGNPTLPDGAPVDPAPWSFVFILVSASGGGSRVETTLMADAGAAAVVRWLYGIPEKLLSRLVEVVVVGEVAGDADAGGGKSAVVAVAVVVIVVGTAAMVVVAGLVVVVAKVAI